MPEWTIVTKDSHPKLYEAFEAISHDRGAGAGHETYSVPKEWADKIPVTEAALTTLSTEELESFCIGEQGEADTIAKRSLSLGIAHAMLNSFFEDWE